MTFLRKSILILFVTAGAVAAGAYFYVKSQLEIAHAPAAISLILDIPRGLGSRDVLQLLREQDVILDENAALIYLLASGNRGRLRAGEYMFDRPMTIPQVIDKLVRGDVYLRKFSVPEGLTLQATARKWEDQGFGSAADFLTAANESVGLIQDLDPKAQSLEGYLFPETYSFPSKTTSHQAVRAMLARFRAVLEKLKQQMPVDHWPRPSIRETIILASLVETEAAHADERAVVASVYLNRLARNILLQCDPTVIYALQLDNKYKGRLTLADLRYDSPYNTYRYAGLPPGPITNPGFAALEAAIKPQKTSYLFFVRTVGGRHTFSESLTAHNRAVRQYRALQRAN